MNHVGIFVYGSIVSLIVLVAFGLMLWASLQDGRDQRAYDRSLHDAERGVTPDARPAVRAVRVD